jgi:hypothetical protein
MPPIDGKAPEQDHGQGLQGGPVRIDLGMPLVTTPDGARP